MNFLRQTLSDESGFGYSDELVYMTLGILVIFFFAYIPLISFIEGKKTTSDINTKCLSNMILLAEDKTTPQSVCPVHEVNYTISTENNQKILICPELRDQLITHPRIIMSKKDWMVEQDHIKRKVTNKNKIDIPGSFSTTTFDLLTEDNKIIAETNIGPLFRYLIVPVLLLITASFAMSLGIFTGIFDDSHTGIDRNSSIKLKAKWFIIRAFISMGLVCNWAVINLSLVQMTYATITFEIQTESNNISIQRSYFGKTSNDPIIINQIKAIVPIKRRGELFYAKIFYLDQGEVRERNLFSLSEKDFGIIPIIEQAISP